MRRPSRVSNHRCPKVTSSTHNWKGSSRWIRPCIRAVLDSILILNRATWTSQRELLWIETMNMIWSWDLTVIQRRTSNGSISVLQQKEWSTRVKLWDSMSWTSQSPFHCTSTGCSRWCGARSSTKRKVSAGKEAALKFNTEGRDLKEWAIAIRASVWLSITRSLALMTKCILRTVYPTHSRCWHLSFRMWALCSKLALTHKYSKPTRWVTLYPVSRFPSSRLLTSNANKTKKLFW